MKKVYIFSIIFVSLFCLVSFASAQSIQPPPGVPDNFPDLLGKIATQVGFLIASLGVIMIIVAGIFYLTSGGSPERIGVAKKALIYAVVGIAIGIAAQAIVDIVLGIIGA